MFAKPLNMMKNKISQIIHFAFKQAMQRKKVLHNIHKSNVLKSSVLWNEIVEEVAVHTLKSS